MSCSTAASAPSMLIGSGLTAAATACSMARHERDAVAGNAAALAPGRRAARCADRWCGRGGRSRAAACRARARLGHDALRRVVERELLRPRERHALGDHAPCSRARRRRGRRRPRAVPAATAAESDWRLPEAPAAPSRRTARRSRDRRRRSGSASSRARSAGDGRRDWCSRKMVSVKVRPVISDGTS